jgi:transcriptional regulator with XRE-family HTH domain
MTTKETDPPAFGVLLRHYRLSAGLTQQALAERAGFSLRGLSDLERGLRRTPYPATVERLSEALELSPADRAVLLASRRAHPAAASGGADRLARDGNTETPQGIVEVRPMPGPPQHGGFPFVGRRAELDALVGALEAGGQGRGSLTLISGEAGIGKTRLVLELAERARALHWEVLRGRATDIEGAPAYLPITEALRAYTNACPPETLRKQLGSAAPELALLLPSIRHRLPEIPRVTTPASESARYFLLSSISEFLVAISGPGRPGLLLVLDDLHWADASTLLLLRVLAPRLTGSRVVVVGTYRSAELDLTPALAEVRAAFSREGTGQHIALSPLSPSDVSEIVADAHGAPVPTGVVESLYAQTDGNPFFVTSMLQQLMCDGRDFTDSEVIAKRTRIPEGVRWFIRQRLSRLSAAANEMLRAGAVLGEWFEFDVLADMLAADDESLVAALDEVLAADTLRPDGTGYRFAHALIRETLYAGLSLPRRRRLHRAAAEALVRADSHTPDDQVGAIAAHYRLAGSVADRTTAIEYSLRAGEEARNVFAWEEAAVHWEAALELMEAEKTDPEVVAGHLENLAHLMAILGWEDYPKRIAYLERALHLYQPLGASARLTRVLTDLASAYSSFARTTDIERSLNYFRAAEALLDAHAGPELRGYFYRRLGNAHLWSGRTTDGLLAHHRAREVEASPSGSGWDAPPEMGWHLAANGNLAEGLAVMERAWETSHQQRQPTLTLQTSFGASAFRSDWAFFLGDPRGALSSRPSPAAGDP